MENENKQSLTDEQMDGAAGGNVTDFLKDRSFICEGCGQTYTMNVTANAAWTFINNKNYCPTCLHAKGLL